MLPEVFLETTYFVILCVVEYLVSWLGLRMKKNDLKECNVLSIFKSKLKTFLKDLS